MAEIDGIKKKINALLSKTLDNGCSEAEAMSAAEKAGELMDHYQLSLTDLQIREEKCVLIHVSTGGVKRGPVDNCAVALARYCDVKMWFSKGRYSNYDEDGKLIGKMKSGKLKYRMIDSKYGVFGLKSDTEIFEYLFAVIKSAIARELVTFQQTEDYLGSEHYKGSKAAKLSATMSFQMGMANAISSKLNTMKNDRIREVKESSGRDLIIVKEELIKEEFVHTGIRLVTSNITRSGGNDWNAAGKGNQAGKNLNLNGGVGTGDSRKAIS